MRGRPSLIATVLVVLGLTASGTPAWATTMQSTVVSPVDGRVTSAPEEPHHTPYGGDYSFDVAGGGAVYARFRNTTGALSLSVASVGRACASGAFADGGDHVTLNVLINGTKVGTVAYSHLTRLAYTSGPVPVGARLGDVATTADGLRSSSCWTGAHVHVEPRNDVEYACYFRGLFGTSVNGATGLGLIGGERATGRNQPCPPGVEQTGSVPFGSLDEARSPEAGRVHVRGWAIDNDDRDAPVGIHLYVGGEAGAPGAEGFDLGPARASRPDVNAAHGAGDAHGFDATVSTSKVGEQPLCAYAIDIGPPGSNQLLGCRTVSVGDPQPFGHLDVAEGRAGAVRVSGWTIDPSTPVTPLVVHVYLGGPAGTPGGEVRVIDAANVPRPDIEAAHPWAGANHGFDHELTTSKRGPQEVCAYAINTGVGSNQLLGCAATTVTEPPSRPGLPSDVTGSVHAESIRKVIAAGVAIGYPDGTYRPAQPVNRGQMSTFLARALDLPLGAGSGYQDAAGSTHDPAIGAIVRAGVASGYGDGTFRPDEPVTRAQMATFLARALDLPVAPPAPFPDAGGTHAANIAAVYAAGITTGRSDGTFGADQPVTRSQMASFLARAFAL